VKRIISLLFVLLLFGAAVTAEDSKLFVVTKPVSKIYVHRLGFKVVYMKNDMNLASFYVPMSWFDEAGGKGTLVKGTDSSYPYFSVYWEEGEFHSIRLYTQRNLNHESWGNLAHTENTAALFDIDEIEVDL
jgi:hypothetical protein